MLSLFKGYIKTQRKEYTNVFFFNNNDDHILQTKNWTLKQKKDISVDITNFNVLLTLRFCF